MRLSDRLTVEIFDWKTERIIGRFHTTRFDYEATIKWDLMHEDWCVRFVKSHSLVLDYVRRPS